MSKFNKPVLGRNRKFQDKDKEFLYLKLFRGQAGDFSPYVVYTQDQN